MSPIGNGYIFRIKRLNQTVEVDSADVKFNETFSDCMDRKGRKIKGGRVLDPNLFNELELEMAADVDKTIASWTPTTFKDSSIKKTTRFEIKNFHDNLQDEDNSSEKDNEGNER
jgi:hypothetical protein